MTITTEWILARRVCTPSSPHPIPPRPPPTFSPGPWAGGSAILRDARFAYTDRMENPHQHILDLTPEELRKQITALGMPPFQPRQIHEWIFQKRAAAFDEMTNLPKPDRTLLAERFSIFTSQIVRSLTSADATRKTPAMAQWPDDRVASPNAS